MCAWRYNAAGAGGASGAGSVNMFPSFQASTTVASGGASVGLSSVAGAGAFLRQNAGGSVAGRSASLFNPSSGLIGLVRAEGESSEEEEEEEEEEHHHHHQQHNQQQQPLPRASLASPAHMGPGVSTTVAGIMRQSGAAHQPATNIAAAAQSLRYPVAPVSISRQLFKMSGKPSAIAAIPVEESPDDEDLDDDMLPADREFIMNTRDLFDEVDPELLSSDFVPHEHVVGIIASETGAEAAPSEISEKLEPYRDLEEEIDLDLNDYIEAHHNEFNDAIADFSEMILAVSGSDDVLARLKQQLVQAATSLDSHAEQLRVLRLRAARSLFMSDTLQQIQDAIAMEADVRMLLSGRHYLRAVQLLQTHRVSLHDPRMKQIRATQGLRDFVESTASTVHGQIIDDLLSCVFRRDRLLEADVEMLNQMMDSSDAANVAVTAPSVENTVQRYWKVAATLDKPPIGMEGVSTNAGNADRAESGGKQRTLAAIVESFYDDPSEESHTKNYLRFIPMCVKSLQLLGRLDNCHAALFSRATKNIERFIAHFLRLYDAWRRRMKSGTSLAGSDGGATVRATRVRAFDLTSDVVSADEAVATVQARDMSALLAALFAELEKILRNANYLYKIIMVACYPFVSEFIVEPTPFDVQATSARWDISNAALGNCTEDLRKIISNAIGGIHKETAQRLKANPSATLQRTLVVMGYLEEFFNFHGMIEKHSKTAVSLVRDPQVRSGSPSVSHSSFSAEHLLSASDIVVTLTLRDVLNYLDGAVASVLAKYPDPDEVEAMHSLHASLKVEITAGVRAFLVERVSQLHAQWDLQVLWSQLNFHIEYVFHVLCDAKEAEEDGDDAISLKPFLKQKNIADRVQRSAAAIKDAGSDETVTLSRLLNSYQTSSGLLRMMEETGSISFSLIGAVKKAQSDVRRANEGQARQFQSVQSDGAKLLALADSGGTGGGVGGANAPLVLLGASGLRNWFVFTAMNAPTCYESAACFYGRCCDRVPELTLLNKDDSVLGFFKRFLRTTYIPTLHAFHSQQLQRLCLSMGDSAELAQAMIDEAGENSPSENPRNAKGGSSSSNSSVWPTVAVPGTAFPVLACVHYVGQVLEKVSSIRDVLPDALAEDVEQSTSEALVVELAAFLKRKVQLVGRGTIPYRLLNSAFEDAFSSIPNKRWSILCDEENLLMAHQPIDSDLYKYYQFNSAQRTSGHEYNRQSAAALDALSALEQGGSAELDERIGLIPAKDLSLRDDSSIVGLAVLCSSTEWLCEALLKNLWPGSRRYDDYTDSVVPGYLFSKQLSAAEMRTIPMGQHGQMRAQQQVRLSTHLSRLCSLSQVALFYLSTDVRFSAFCYLPQLRDESYNIVASSSSADTFVQAYSRRITKIYQLVRPYLHAKKIKYTCLTAGKPASELILMELAHLRDKGISEAGLARLRTDLLVMQTTLQLILPTDVDVREAVGRHFTRPAVFLRYILNRDVVNEIMTSGDYKRFSVEEVEELIRLVFRQVSGANDDTLARQNIDLLHHKIDTMHAVQQQRSMAAEQTAAAARPPMAPPAKLSPKPPMPLPLAPSKLNTAQAPPAPAAAAGDDEEDYSEESEPDSWSEDEDVVPYPFPTPPLTPSASLSLRPKGLAAPAAASPKSVSISAVPVKAPPPPPPPVQPSSAPAGKAAVDDVSSSEYEYEEVTDDEESGEYEEVEEDEEEEEGQ